MCALARSASYKDVTKLFVLYSERAAECRREAEGTILPNVREQCLRSALAWEDMADRERLAEWYRVEEARRKREQLADDAHRAPPLEA